jgi:hypothetical protein
MPPDFVILLYLRIGLRIALRFARRELGRLEDICLDGKPFARILCLSMIKDAKAAGFA